MNRVNRSFAVAFWGEFEAHLRFPFEFFDIIDGPYSFMEKLKFFYNAEF